jgi:hypothetical protein
MFVCSDTDHCERAVAAAPAGAGSTAADNTTNAWTGTTSAATIV